MITSDYLLVRIFVSTMPVILFLIGLNLLDSFKLVRPRAILYSVIAGIFAAVLCYFINTRLVHTLGWSPDIYSRYAGPLIEESIKGNPFAIWVNPETQCPVIYFKDAALAIIKLAEAPIANIKMVNYVIGGATPIASAQELADIVKDRIPNAQIDFKPDPEIQMFFDKLMMPIDDGIARKEWNWKPEYDHERIVDDFVEEMRSHPDRYA